MIPLGVLGSAHHSAPSGGATTGLVDVQTNPASGNTHTYTDVNFGPEHPQRQIVVGILCYGTSYAGVVSVTIGGVSATIDTATSATSSSSAIARVALPAGASGEVRVTFTAGKNLPTSVIAAYALIGLGAPLDAKSASSYAISSGQTGFGIAIVNTINATSWEYPTGYVADYEAGAIKAIVSGNNTPESGSLSFLTGAGSVYRWFSIAVY